MPEYTFLCQACNEQTTRDFDERARRRPRFCQECLDFRQAWSTMCSPSQAHPFDARCAGCHTRFYAPDRTGRRFCDDCAERRAATHNRNRSQRPRLTPPRVRPKVVEPVVPEKRCGDCGCVKACSQFHRCQQSLDGLRSECKDCAAIRKVEQRHRMKADPHRLLRFKLRKRVVDRHRSLAIRMRSAIRLGRQVTFKSLGYDVDDLKRHLERQFTKGMDWPAFMRGEVHIDHRVPLSAFDLDDEVEVRSAWALTNLQPLWAADNLAKGGRRSLLV